MGGLMRALGGLLRRSARLLPADLRPWAEALCAEAGEVPAGRQRVAWLGGGLRLVMREAQIVRRIVYRLGVAVVAVAVAGLVWRAWPGRQGDVEISVDRVRVIVLAAVLAGLPWVARRRGIFGPAGHSAVARLVRVGGCAALCALVLAVVWIDQTNRDLLGLVGAAHWGTDGGGNVAPADPVDWPGEATGLAVIVAYLAAVLILKARWRGDPDLMWASIWGGALTACMFALVLLVIQMFVIVYAAGIFAATARRSPVTPAAVGAGAAAGAIGSLVVYGLTLAALHPGGWLIFLVVLAAPTTAGLVAAWWAPGTSGRAGQREARTLQGLAAGVVAGAAVALLITILNGQLLLLLGGPLAGVAFGSLGGTIGAAHPRKPPPGRSWSGVFVISS